MQQVTVVETNVLETHTVKSCGSRRPRFYDGRKGLEQCLEQCHALVGYTSVLVCVALILYWYSYSYPCSIIT